MAPSESSAQARRLSAALLSAGIIDPERAERAELVLAQSLDRDAVEHEDSRRSALGEITGYVGGVLILAAGAVFLGMQWDQLGIAQRVAALLAGAALLGAGAVVARVLAHRESGGESNQRLRLSSALGVGAAGLLSAAVGTGAEHAWTDPDLPGSSDRIPALAFTVLALACAIAYVLARTAFGQLALGFAATVAIATGAALVPTSIETATRSGGLMLLGLLWLIAAEAGWWRERETGRAIGCAILLFGAQLAVTGNSHQWASYVLMGVTGLAAFAVHLRRPHWPYLTLGVAATTLAATEAALDFFGDGGAALGLLVAGAVLLATSLLALKLHRSAPASDAQPAREPGAARVG